MKRFALPLLAAAVLLALWAPWITGPDASRRAEEDFRSAWEGVVDSCGLGCRGCGARAVGRGLAGVHVEIEYACGLIPSDEPEFHQVDLAFVSLLGTVSGLPRP